jgi:4-hydroxybenzoate polyprenyltransferase
MPRQRARALLELLRWHKPSGRLILLIPALWSLWLASGGMPPLPLLGWIVLGALAVSGAGCIANDLWDRRLDPHVERTANRPLASGRVGVPAAVALLLLTLVLALLVVVALPPVHRQLCLLLALGTLPPVLLYPSAKRWFGYPQAVLALCWGFAVLLPWAAVRGSLSGGWPLWLTWGATLLWTFGFDTARSLGDHAPLAVALCYGATALALAAAAALSGVSLAFWPLWLLAAVLMQQQAAVLRRPALPAAAYGRHFQRQVQLGALLLLALIVGLR